MAHYEQAACHRALARADGAAQRILNMLSSGESCVDTAVFSTLSVRQVDDQAAARIAIDGLALARRYAELYIRHGVCGDSSSYIKNSVVILQNRQHLENGAF